MHAFNHHTDISFFKLQKHACSRTPVLTCSRIVQREQDSLSAERAALIKENALPDLFSRNSLLLQEDMTLFSAQPNETMPSNPWMHRYVCLVMSNLV